MLPESQTGTLISKKFPIGSVQVRQYCWLIVLVICVSVLPAIGAARANANESYDTTIIFATNRGLFRIQNAAVSPLGGFAPVLLGYNKEAGVAYIINDDNPRDMSNTLVLSSDAFNSWETIEPVKTGLKTPNGQPVMSFANFGMSDSGIWVAGIGFGVIAIKSDALWKTLDVSVTDSNWIVIGNELFSASAGGHSGELVGIDLDSQKIRKTGIQVNSRTGGYSLQKLGSNWLAVLQNQEVRVINVADLTQISTLGSGMSRIFGSEYGLVAEKRTENKIQAYNPASKRTTILPTVGGEWGYFQSSTCTYRVSSAGLVCADNSGTGYSFADFPESQLSDLFWVGAVEVSRQTSVHERMLVKPALFVSGLGGGRDGDLYWEGPSPKSVRLKTKSGFDYKLSVSDWQTGQKGYFLTFDGYDSYEVCGLAEVVGAASEYIRSKERAEKLDLIGYSMGGLLARCYIEDLIKNYPYAGDVDHLLLIGVPNNGSFLAGAVGPLVMLADLLKGKQAIFLSPYSMFIDLINSHAIPNQIRTTSFYGGGFWLPIIERHDGLVSVFDARLKSTVFSAGVREIYLPNAVHTSFLAIGNGKTPILEDRELLFDTIRQMNEGK